MRATGVADGLAAVLAAALLAWPVVAGDVWWGAWLACSLAGTAAGVSASLLARGTNRVRDALAAAVLIVPAGLLLIPDPWWGGAYLIAGCLGILAGRQRFRYAGR